MTASSAKRFRRALRIVLVSSVFLISLVPWFTAGCGGNLDGYSSNGQLRIVSLTADVVTLHGPTADDAAPADTVTFFAVVTHRAEAGALAISGGLLVDDAGNTYAAFNKSSTTGTYTATVDWPQIHRTRSIDVRRPGAPRRFVAKFFDGTVPHAGDRGAATMEIDIYLTCGGNLDACGGVCRESC